MSSRRYVLDKQFTGFAANIWKLGSAKVDKDVLLPAISTDGRMHIMSQPLGPETKKEKVVATYWGIARELDDVEIDKSSCVTVTISSDGELVGDIGLHYIPETQLEIRAGR